MTAMVITKRTSPAAISALTFKPAASGKSRAIVEAIVSLAVNLGMKTIAEWAEDAATVQTLGYRAPESTRSVVDNALARFSAADVFVADIADASPARRARRGRDGPLGRLVATDKEVMLPTRAGAC